MTTKTKQAKAVKLREEFHSWFRETYPKGSPNFSDAGAFLRTKGLTGTRRGSSGTTLTEFLCESFGNSAAADDMDW